MPPLPKDRGAEQGDVDGPLECSLALSSVAMEARGSVARLQRQDVLPWCAADGIGIAAARADYDQRSQLASDFEATPCDAAGARIDPRHSVQVKGGLVDFWYLDDGDILCDPRLVVPYLDAFDQANTRVGAIRNVNKTEVLYYATQEELDQHGAAWAVDRVAALATVSLASAGTPTLGVATGPATYVANQLARKTKVIQAMHERVQLCHDAQTELVLAKQSLGAGRVNHILRVHGHRVAGTGGATEAFDGVGQATLKRLFPGITAEGHEQSALSVSEGGLGWRTASDVARPAHLGALVATGPRIRAMIHSAAEAGLLSLEKMEARLEDVTDSARAAFLERLDEVERVRAEEFIDRAKLAANEAFQRVVGGAASPEPPPPVLNHETGEAGDDDGDDAPPGAFKRVSASQLQKELSKLVDQTKARRLDGTLIRMGAWPQLDRLKELRHKEVSHKWLAHLDVKSGAVLTATDFVVNVQKRLGARVFTGVSSCRLCGAHLDAQLEHAELCCTAEAT